MNKARKLRFVFTGGGTGGHLFPALAVLQAVKALEPESECIFLGRADKLEGKLVPQAGIPFFAIPGEGINRRNKLRNIVVLFKFIAGYLKALKVCITFKPDAALGTGGYTSAAPILAARFMGAKTVLLESNSYPGIATKWLERKADAVFLAYEDAKQYLRNKEKLFVTGNPVRVTIEKTDRAAALQKLGLSADKQTLVLIGGSLGADALNRFVAGHGAELVKGGIQIILQTGKSSFDKYADLESESIKVRAFFDSIQDVYSAGDVFVCRAGAATISELQYLGLPVILVPSPYVTENHQYHNAKALADAQAAVLVEEKEIPGQLLPVIVSLLSDEARRKTIAENCKQMATPKSAEIIAERLIALAKSTKVF